MKFALGVLVLVGGFACSDTSEPPDPPLNIDAGFPPDSDNDGIEDGVDNCPNQPNSDQVDFDQDGAGDVCDVCLSVPEDGETVCLQALREQEPNNEPESANELPLPEIGAVIEVLGTLEAQTSSSIVVDWFEHPNVNMEPENPILLSVRVEARGENLDFEPRIRIWDPDSLASVREVEGVHLAEREFLVWAGVRRIEVSDRRGPITQAADYVLRLERRSLQWTSIEPPSSSESVVFDVSISESNRIPLLETQISFSDFFLRYETYTSLGGGSSSSGVDTILRVNGAPENNDKFFPTTDSRVTLKPQINPQRVAIDFAKIVGNDADRRIQVEVAFNHLFEEPEPNDVPGTASELPYQGSIYGQFYEKNPPTTEDIDWWWFWGRAGDWACFFFRPILNQSLGFRPQLTLGYFEGDTWHPIEQLQTQIDGDGSMSICTVLPQDLQYFVRIQEVDGKQIPEGIMSPEQSRVWVVVERDEFKQWTPLHPIRYPDNFERFVVSGVDYDRRLLFVSERMRLNFNTLQSWADYEPRIRIYEHNMGYIAEGLRTLTATLAPNVEPYVVYIRNSLPEVAVGNGDTGPEFEIEIIRTPL